MHGFIALSNLINGILMQVFCHYICYNTIKQVHYLLLKHQKPDCLKKALIFEILPSF